MNLHAELIKTVEMAMNATIDKARKAIDKELKPYNLKVDDILPYEEYKDLLFSLFNGGDAISFNFHIAGTEFSDLEAVYVMKKDGDEIIYYYTTDGGTEECPSLAHAIEEWKAYSTLSALIKKREKGGLEMP